MTIKTWLMTLNKTVPRINGKNVLTTRFDISGIVQGVGFRPFLFRLAHQYGLKGEVYNSAQGVTLILQGSENTIEMYRNSISLEKPPLAIVSSIDQVPVDHQAHQLYSAFQISDSQTESHSKTALISPDVSVCIDCLREMNDPQDRRLGYPFINCTNCGPRYTIIRDVPYDRPKTSMVRFTMCSGCQSEYDDPLNRRFHAQPNACPKCGPHLFFVESPQNKPSKELLTENDAVKSDSSQKGRDGRRLVMQENEHRIDEKSLSQATALLRQGKVLAVKGLGGFHLAVDAFNHDAVLLLRRRKRRPQKPFALMATSVEAVSQLVEISDGEKEILESHTRPILLLAKRNKALDNKQTIGLSNLPPQSLGLLQDAIAPDNGHIGVMLPYTPLHELLLKQGPSVLVMTSGNRSGEPLSIDNQDALDAFSHIADGFLLHNRDIYFRADDSIMQYHNGQSRFIRRSRGYAPLPIDLKSDLFKPILACGGGLKSTICLAKENKAFLSQHIGDLDNEKVFGFYHDSIEHLKRIFDIQPQIIAHDLHPGYMSTAYAETICRSNQEEPVKKGGLQRIAVQHHHAHALSCMAENGLNGPVIAVTLDGTGLGTDGHIWGGEVLVCGTAGFDRKAHLAYLPMPGGDSAVNEPWRMAISALYLAFGQELTTLTLPLLDGIENEKLDFIVQMVEKKINTPLTSSCGRLFDAVASLLSVCNFVTFESQAAMALEALSASPLDGTYTSYPFELIETKPPSIATANTFENLNIDGFFTLKGKSNENEKILWKIETGEMIKSIVKDILSGEKQETIGARFHQTIIQMFVAAVKKVHHETGLKKVVLSGGVFHNEYLLTGLMARLEDENLRVYTHRQVPCGDGGISLGQILAADAASSNKHKRI